MKPLTRSTTALATNILLLASLCGFVPTATAEGTDTLGPLEIDVKQGTGIVTAGTGLLQGPSSIIIDVPGRVKQVLLYWEGESRGVENVDDIDGDEIIDVNGQPVTGQLIGGPVNIVRDRFSSAYRADITDLNLVRRGANSLDISGLDITTPHGAGLAVIYKKRRTKGEVILRDGVDTARPAFPDTVPQTFTFDPSTNERMAKINLFVSGVSGEASGDGFRPSAIYVTVGDDVQTFDDILDSVSGQEWDTVTLDVLIPANEDTVTVELESIDNQPIDPDDGDPASFSWTFASLSIDKDRGCYKRKRHNRTHGYHHHGHYNGTHWLSKWSWH